MDRFMSWFMDRVEQLLYVGLAILFICSSILIPIYAIVMLRVEGMGSGWYSLGSTGLIVVALVFTVLMFYVGWSMLKPMIPNRLRQWYRHVRRCRA